MGQLIKLQDYVSRYEQNIFHYPSRFVLLKKQQWEKLRNLWENPNEMTFFTQTTQQNGILEEDEKHPYLKKIKSVFTRRKETEHRANFKSRSWGIRKQINQTCLKPFQPFFIVLKQWTI